MRWRRAIALAIYMFPRAGELRALEWSDVDLEHGTVHIHQALEHRSRAVKSTKRREGPVLLPLLRVLHAEASGKGEVMPIPNRMASRLREWLGKAKITRKELTDETSKTTKPLAWHDLRATGLTWCAVRGDGPLKIMSRAGHEDFATTPIYIRTAEAIRGGLWGPDAALPACLLGPALSRPSESPGGNGAETPSKQSRTRDSNLGHPAWDESRSPSRSVTSRFHSR